VPWQVKFMLLALIWGASFLFIKAALGLLQPLQVGAGRILLGAATTGALAAAARARMPRSWRVWAHLQVTSLLLCTLPFLLFPVGEERVSSALAGIGNAITPVATVLATAALLPHETFSRRKLLAVAGGFVGVVVIMAPWRVTERPDLWGFGATLVAGCCYGLGWTYIKRFLRPEDLPGLALPAAQLLSAAGQITLVTVGWWALQRDSLSAPWSPRPDAATPGMALLALLALGVLGTGLAYALQFDVFRAVGQQVSSTVTYLIPVVAVLLGVLVLGEHLTATEVIGFVIVLASAIVIGLPEPSRRVPS
jgi:drug/metabolite transporter (DMT)-like permease